MARTKVDEELERAEAQHHGDSPRAELLRRARRFKASWVELAESLTEAQRRGHWKRWGYASFEDYTKKELHLRKETVDKLCGCFTFLQRRAPEVLERNGLDDEIPTYQAVDFWRRADSQEDAPRDVVDEIRRRVVEEGDALPAITREYKDKVFPIDENTRRVRDAAGVKNVATRLKELLAESSVVPKALAKEAAEVLERVLEAVSAADEKAA